MFFIGFAAAFLPPRFFWWTGIFASGLPFLFAAAVGATLLALVERGWRWVPLIVLLATLGYLRFLPNGFARADEKVEGPALVLMTYNAPVRGPSPDTLIAVTLGLVREVQPEVLALQEPAIWREPSGEVRATAHLQALIDSLDYHAPRPRAGTRLSAIMQPVIATFPLVEAQQFTLSPPDAEGRPTFATRVAFSWENRDAVLYNVHLNTTGLVKPWQDSLSWRTASAWKAYLKQYRSNYLRRADEAVRLRALLDRETLPVLVVGDFNSTVHHWEFRHVARGLVDAFTVAGRGWGATYHARVPLFRIDHVLVGPEWAVDGAYVADQPTLSDHRPLIVHLKWKTLVSAPSAERATGSSDPDKP